MDMNVNNTQEKPVGLSNDSHGGDHTDWEEDLLAAGLKKKALGALRHIGGKFLVCDKSNTNTSNNNNNNSSSNPIASAVCREDEFNFLRVGCHYLLSDTNKNANKRKRRWSDEINGFCARFAKYSNNGDTSDKYKKLKEKEIKVILNPIWKDLGVILYQNKGLKIKKEKLELDKIGAATTTTTTTTDGGIETQKLRQDDKEDETKAEEKDKDVQAVIDGVTTASDKDDEDRKQDIDTVRGGAAGAGFGGADNKLKREYEDGDPDSKDKNKGKDNNYGAATSGDIITVENDYNENEKGFKDGGVTTCGEDELDVLMDKDINTIKRRLAFFLFAQKEKLNQLSFIKRRMHYLKMNEKSFDQEIERKRIMKIKQGLDQLVKTTILKIGAFMEIWGLISCGKKTGDDIAQFVFYFSYFQDKKYNQFLFENTEPDTHKTLMDIVNDAKQTELATVFKTYFNLVKNAKIESQESKLDEKESEKSKFIEFVKGLEIDDMSDDKLTKFGKEYDSLIKMAMKENEKGIVAFAVKVGFGGDKYEFERSKIATQLMAQYPKQQPGDAELNRLENTIITYCFRAYGLNYPLLYPVTAKEYKDNIEYYKDYGTKWDCKGLYIYDTRGNCSFRYITHEIPRLSYCLNAYYYCYGKKTYKQLANDIGLKPTELISMMK